MTESITGEGTAVQHYGGLETVKVTSSCRKDFLQEVSFKLGLERMVGLLHRN